MISFKNVRIFCLLFPSSNLIAVALLISLRKFLMMQSYSEFCDGFKLFCILLITIASLQIWKGTLWMYLLVAWLIPSAFNAWYPCGFLHCWKPLWKTGLWNQRLEGDQKAAQYNSIILCNMEVKGGKTTFSKLHRQMVSEVRSESRIPTA